MEVRRIKARVDKERLPRGADPNTHLKLGRGGLADIEWTVQLLQMRHAATVPGLRTSRTLEALAAAREAGLLGASRRRRADQRAGGWVSRVRNAVTLVRGKGSDQLPARHPRAGGGGERPRLPARRDRRDGQRPAAHHAGLARASWTGCSGDDRRATVRAAPGRHQAPGPPAGGARRAGRRLGGRPPAAWVALPPGAGKTLLGLETIKDRIAAGAVGKAVVLGPNTAIQGQWVAQAAALGLDVGTDRVAGARSPR